MNITREFLEHPREADYKAYCQYMAGGLRLQSPEETFVVPEFAERQEFEVLDDGILKRRKWEQAYLRPKILR